MAETFSSSGPAIAIVGGGLSGVLVAANILRRARQPVRLLLFERGPAFGRGTAYGTDCDTHLLNVPAGRMGAWPEDPEHFLNWVRGRTGQLGFPDSVQPTDFLPRRLYGDYLTALFAEARQGAAATSSCTEIQGEVVDLEESSGGGGRLTLADGRRFTASHVVLALGNLPGEYPIKRPLPVYHSPRYVHVPWRGDALEAIGKQDEVLLVGQGLTATDLMVQLDSLGHRGTIHALSRRGLRPQVHRLGPAYPTFPADAALPTTVRTLFHQVRTAVREAATQGVDWRAVIDGLRPQSQALWLGLSWEERARFMRHVRPHWEVHRHRIAPQLAAVIESMVAEGRLKFYAGRLESLEETPDGVAAAFFQRTTAVPTTLQVKKVINCTGPRTDYSKYQHPLLINLLSRALIDHDPLALGINALPDGTVLRYRGGPVGWLHTLGAPLKGVLWESTALPEIRLQAKRMVEKLIAS